MTSLFLKGLAPCLSNLTYRWVLFGPHGFKWNQWLKWKTWDVVVKMEVSDFFGKVWQYWLAVPREEIDSGWIETQDLWCALAPSCLTGPGMDFQGPAAVYQLLPSLLHTLTLSASRAQKEAGAGLEEVCLSRMREIDSGQGWGRSVSGRDLWPFALAGRIVHGCGNVLGSQWGWMQSATAPLDWSLRSCTALRCRAEAAFLWLSSDLGGKNSKEWMSEGPGKMTQWTGI